MALAVQELARNEKKLFLATGPGTQALTGESCSPFGIHLAYDNYALGKVLAKTLVGQGKENWFFITADYSFGHSLEAVVSQFIRSESGRDPWQHRPPAGHV